MKIQIDGTNTANKGAELMLYAILQEIERRFSNSVVFYNPNSVDNPIPILTDLQFKTRFPINNKLNRYPLGILRRLGLPHSYFTPKYANKDIDIVLDGGGFQFSDQWNYSTKSLDVMENYYSKLKKNKTKLIFLSQAFGPFNTENGKRSVKIISKYADLIVARELISYNYLLAAGANESKVICFPDFTLPVSGANIDRFSHVKGKVCIIPNKKMITHAGNNSSQYLFFVKSLVRVIESSGLEVFLLNHESSGDFNLCKNINKELGGHLEILTNLNALEVKGVIGISYAVISSRFHGVASALSQGIPCMATSWNHKYEMLFKDYNQSGMILKLDDVDQLAVDLQKILDYDSNREISAELLREKAHLSTRISDMWEKVWKI
ncbi:colanic acid/amylovoran biosynthesis protein [Algoriphagus sp. 4150]|uniref:polysaccharide pyruvyl transferase family protein n=1 Tax=Algoriphagus sp. 4150 TaxID=2817756 RepID=UPI0028654B85|nr:polysaccharide pyruvyl transferase family protein [Algoriphagus sp. 4150]MDR7127771.1 colanic acid/amylovoran biosynthesis protein [Algoriphagus sp. 4150]